MYIRQIQYRVFGLAFRKFVKTGDRHSKLSNLSNSFLRCSVCDLSYTMVRTVCHTADKEKTGRWRESGEAPHFPSFFSSRFIKYQLQENMNFALGCFMSENK